ncbi:MAG: cupin domain-containing protein [Symbiobacteriaceae bacterium]|nr:cupin domain-containing protein [Symbiobacteriaceae bacterium]
MHNIFELPELPLAQELVTTLMLGKNVRIERIVSTGQVSDWYNQPDTEYVILLQGEATLEYPSGKTVKMQAGDTLLLLPKEEHRVIYTSTEPCCIWLCIFFTALVG